METNKELIYLDQNIVQYIFDGKLDLKFDSEIDWIYSIEHFKEISLQNKLEYLGVFEQLKARRINIELDDKYHLTNRAYIEAFNAPKVLYEQYETNLKESLVPDINLKAFQAFAFGNSKAINPKEYTSSFVGFLKDLMDKIFDEADSEERALYTSRINAIASEMPKALEMASKTIKPIKEMRKRLSKKHFSGLNRIHGKIIDQIWNIIKDNVAGTSKEQFFGEPGSNSKDNIPIYLKIVKCYSALNWIGYWPDNGISDEIKLHGIASDSYHVGYASYCKGILSADDRLCKKAVAIYEYLNISTNVFQWHP